MTNLKIYKGQRKGFNFKEIAHRLIINSHFT